jgi:hypothetical protein
MAIKIRFVRTANHEGEYFVAVEGGKRYEPSQVAGNMNFQVVESIQESAVNGRGGIATITATESLKKSRQSQLAAYMNLGLSEAEAKVAAGLEDCVIADADIFERFCQR